MTPPAKPEAHAKESRLSEEAIAGLRSKLNVLETRLVRMRELHADSKDPLAALLISRTEAERAELRAKLPLGG